MDKEKKYNLKGRAVIYTDEREITGANVISVLQDAWEDFLGVRSEISYLINYEAGEQEETRVKKYRKEIDNWCVDNIANEITDFKTGYIWGNPISLVQRGERDTGRPDETAAIAQLNECYQSQDINSKLQELARYIEICGIGFTYVDINREYADGESPFIVNVLDPRWAFLVRSSRRIDKAPVMGVTCRKANNGDMYFTCFTKDRRYDIKNLVKKVNASEVWDHLPYSGEKNPLGMIPIVEWIRSYDRMGCFERQIDEMNNLNLLVSDFTNDVDQNTQAVWWTNNVDFPEREILDKDGNPTGEFEIEKPKDGDWLMTNDTPDGSKGSIQPLVINYDYPGMLQNIVTRRALILQKCNVPQRGGGMSGATGVAMDDTQGWNHAEADAAKQQLITESCKMAEVRVALRAASICPDFPVDSPLLRLRPMDVMPVVVRSRNYDLNTKINSFATAVSHGVHGLHALRMSNLFPDVNQVWEDSRELIEKYQESSFIKDETGDETPDRLRGDLSDQVGNSPRIDGPDTDLTVIENG